MNRDSYFTKNILRTTTTPNIPQAVLLILVCVGLWFSAYLGQRFTNEGAHTDVISQQVNTFFTPDSLLSNLIALAFTLLNTFLISQVNTRFTLIRNRTFLPVFLFLLMMSCWNGTHALHISHLLLILFIFMLFYLFSSQRNRNASEQAFMGTFLLSICSLSMQPLLFLIPVCWIGLGMFQSLSLRTFLASVFGAAAPWLLYIAIRLLLSGTDGLKDIIHLQPSFVLNISQFHIATLVYSGLMAVIMIIGLISMQSMSRSESIHTRSLLRFLILLFAAVLTLMLLYQQMMPAFLPVVALLYALLISYSFTLQQGLFTEIVYMVFLVINLAFVVSRYFI